MDTSQSENVNDKKRNTTEVQHGERGYKEILSSLKISKLISVLGGKTVLVKHPLQYTSTTQYSPRILHTSRNHYSNWSPNYLIGSGPGQ